MSCSLLSYHAVQMTGGRLKKKRADLDNLHVGAEEEEVGGGGDAVVVNVLPPGPTLSHLRAL